MDARAILLSVAVALLYVLANVLTEKSLEEGKSHYMGYVSLVAVIAFWGFRWTCQHFGLAVASAVVDSLLTLLTVAYAIFVLKDSLSTIQYVGVFFLLIGLLLVKGPWSGEKESKQESAPGTVETSP
jgi:multidrug transporter EmrE-like cation transporter